MNAAQRRKVILERLTEADAPLSASVLAGELGVSRQIVVGDVALLRASGTQIDATPRGYQLHPAARGYTGILACVHSTADQMREELYTVVDQGGIVVDVAVENPLYGEQPCQPVRRGPFYPAGGGHARVPAEPDDRRCASAHLELPHAGGVPPHRSGTGRQGPAL